MYFPTESTTPSYKVVLLGDSQVGKTSILCMQINGYPPAQPTATIGCLCSDIDIRTTDKPLIMKVWDTAGQEDYRSLVPIYIRGAHAAILVFDVTDEKTFEGISRWIDLINSTMQPTPPLFLVANKIDLIKGKEDMANFESFARNMDIPLIKTSAVTGHGVNQLFDTVANALLKHYIMVPKTVETLEDSKDGKCC
ncbi:Ras-related protein Rab-5A [Tritrichomonas foetus]|uniref:Ras-related protein Rab-5A n=1 Tax=Tritrichomonas foetus TaxID=1144522 RepID=A0A1J4KVE0_9EUKA|nr:Ras-related protein Rab-5A [Tritrichomonas foetus]|eukprot:OHT15114.1 Ras-related protein Rab-5A [Tritrichomonas foetus]